VKTEVSRREEDIDNLRDAVDAENTKIVRLERLMKQYSSALHGDAASPTAVTHPKKSTGRAEFSSNRSTASSYISAESSTYADSAPRLQTSQRAAAREFRQSANGERSSGRLNNSTASTAIRPRSSASRTASAGLTTKTATPSTVAEGLRQLRLNRTTGSQKTEIEPATAIESEDDYVEAEMNRIISYELSDEEEPLPPPSWMKQSKF